MYLASKKPTAVSENEHTKVHRNLGLEVAFVGAIWALSNVNPV
jgi:hypothetical protein